MSRASHIALMAAQDLPPAPAGAEVPEWIHLAPAGRIETHDARGPYEITDPQAVIEASFATRGEIEIDVNHASFTAAASGGDAPARGWITEMQSREDGIWGKVRWTKEGARLVADQAYRRISPVFQLAHEGSSQVVAILNASLVNRQNLRGLTALNYEKEERMPFLQKLAALVGLGADASEDQVMAAIKKLKTGGEGATAAQSQLAEVATLLGVPAGGDVVAAAKAKATSTAPDVVALPRVDLPSNPTKPRGKSGASTSAYDRERKAIEELLRREQERLEILRETDPVLQEMIRHRETMASATDKEREALEAIIRKRVVEQNAIEAAQGAAELLGDVSGDVLTALTARGDEATDAWRRVKAAIAAAVLEAALLGEGSLAGLFGTSESGGLFGKIFKRAEGGIITGKGGDRADQEIVLASPGEFFVNAKATRKHRHLLEAINAGALLPGMIPSFANGGAFAAPPVAPGGFAASGVSGERGASRVLIEPSPLFRAVVKEQAQDTALEVVQGHDRENSNATFDRNLNDPWSIG